VIGTLAACLAAGTTMREAAVLANVAASVVVGEVGTVPITAEKLLRAVELRNSEQRRSGEPPQEGGVPLPDWLSSPGYPAVGRTAGTSPKS